LDLYLGVSGRAKHVLRRGFGDHSSRRCIEKANLLSDVYTSGEKLDLKEATQIAVARNLNIEVTKLEQAIRHCDPSIAKSIYDTQWNASGNWFFDKAEPPNIVLGSRVVEGDVTTSLSKLLPTGTTLSVEGSTRRQSSNSLFSTAPIYYESYMTLSAKQQLLRNFFGYIDRKKIRQVVINTQKFDYATLDQMEATIEDVRFKFWDLLFSLENLKAKQKNLERAQEFYQIEKKNHEIGLVEKPDLYAATANMKRRYVEALAAKNIFYKASYALRALLRAPEVEWIVPVSDMIPGQGLFDRDKALKWALTERWDVKQMNLILESQDLEVKIKRSESLPNLTLSGTWTGTSLDREMASSQGEVFSYNHPQYGAGFQFSTPIERRKERNELKQARLEFEKQKKEKTLLELEIERQVDSAWQDLQLTSAAIVQTAAVETLQKQKLEEEEKQFRRGRSTSKTIIDYQQDVIDAENSRIIAALDHHKAIERFYRVQNKLLEYAGVAKALNEKVAA